MYAFRCLRCACLHGWFDHPAVTRVRSECREPIVAGRLVPGTTGVQLSWRCPQCDTRHFSVYGERPPTEPAPDEIRLRAYFSWEAAGRPVDDDVHFWLEAEQELRLAPTFAMEPVT